MVKSHNPLATLDHAGHALLQTLLNAAVDGMIVIDETGQMLMFNRGAEQLFGYSAEEAVGEKVNMLMAEPDRSQHDHYLDHYQQTGEQRIIGIGREVTGRKRNGQHFLLDLAVGETTVDGQRLYVGILRDLSNRARLEALLSQERKQVKQLERSLAHVHRASTLGEMAAGIAHEINQPLSAIATYADAGRRFLHADDASIERVDHALKQVAGQARRAGEVVRRMRDLARRDEAHRETTSINSLIEDLVELTRLEARELDAPIQLDLLTPSPMIHVDAIQIQQVLLNLCRNSLESMSHRSQAKLGLIIRSTQVDDDQVRISVIDHGLGVDPDQAEHMFDPFVTSKPNGMGIGLSICRTIVTQHGGRLWYEPNPDGGSVFSFTLPALPNHEPSDTISDSS